MKLKLIRLLLLVVFGGSILGVFFWWYRANQPITADAKKGLFVVKKGESLTSVSRRLKEENIIRSSFAFRLKVMRRDLAQQVQAGDFYLSSSMTPAEIINELIHGRIDQWVTLLEGWRSEEIVRELINSGFQIEAEEWQKLVAKLQLEGYLFPDTYLLPRDAEAEKIISTLKDNFNRRVDEEIRAKIESKGLTFEDGVVLASIIEREAGADTDRPVIAAILLKRLENGWPLQADATIQYLVGGQSCRSYAADCQWWPDNLTRTDLEITSPFNTYKNQGLPPAPICNPGLASIKAVATVPETGYWFYLHDLKGGIHYAATLEEHQANVAKYLGK